VTFYVTRSRLNLQLMIVAQPSTTSGTRCQEINPAAKNLLQGAGSKDRREGVGYCGEPAPAQLSVGGR